MLCSGCTNVYWFHKGPAEGREVSDTLGLGGAGANGEFMLKGGKGCRMSPIAILV